MKKFNKISVKTIKFGVFSAMMAVTVQHTHALTAEQTAQIMAKCDDNNNGKIEGKEFVCKVNEEGKRLDKEYQDAVAEYEKSVAEGKKADAEYEKSVAEEKRLETELRKVAKDTKNSLKKQTN